MIPDRDFLELHYDRRDVIALEGAAKLIKRLPEKSRPTAGRKFLRSMWDNEIDWIQNTHYIQTKTEGIVPFRLKPAQRKVYDLLTEIRLAGETAKVIILKARQVGISTLAESLNYEACDAGQQRKALVLSYKEEHSRELGEMAKTIHENMWFPRPTRRLNRSLIEFDSPHGSSLRTLTGGSETVGRGFTAQHLHTSELPFWPSPETSLLSAMNALALGAGSTIVHEFTARGASGVAYEMWQEAVRGENGYHAVFIPWYLDPEYSIPFPDKEAKRLFGQSMTREEINYQQAHGLSLERMNWRRVTMQTKCRNLPKMFRQEYPATDQEAFIASGSSVFDPEIVDQMAKMAKPPMITGDIILLKTGRDETPAGEPDAKPLDGVDFDAVPSRFSVDIRHHNHGGHLEIWDVPKETGRYVIGVDFAEGKVRDLQAQRSAALAWRRDRPDYNAAIVIEVHSLDHVATMHGHMPLVDWTEMVVALGIYYRTALLVPELNGPGTAVVDSILRRFRYPAIYKTRAFSTLDQDFGNEYGWRTSSSSRSSLILNIEDWIGRRACLTRDRKLISELRTMQEDEHGKKRACGSDKDDRVMALGMALQGVRDYAQQYQSTAPAEIEDFSASARAWRVFQQTIENHGRPRNRPVRRSFGRRRYPWMVPRT